jgi:hypothetical protein
MAGNHKDSIVWREAGESDDGRLLSDVIRILESIEQGDPKTADKLLPLVYEELQKAGGGAHGEPSAQPDFAAHRARA